MSTDQDYRTITTILEMGDEDEARAICQRFKAAVGTRAIHPSTLFNVNAQLAANAIFRMSADPVQRQEVARLMFEYVIDLIEMQLEGLGEQLPHQH